jgi:hypothetical protein
MQTKLHTLHSIVELKTKNVFTDEKLEDMFFMIRHHGTLQKSSKANEETKETWTFKKLKYLLIYKPQSVNI